MRGLILHSPGRNRVKLLIRGNARKEELCGLRIVLNKSAHLKNFWGLIKKTSKSCVAQGCASRGLPIPYIPLSENTYPNEQKE